MALVTMELDPNATAGLTDGPEVVAALKAMADVDREVVLTAPVSGEYPVVYVQRNASGKLAAVYDDTPIP